jgi:hypothetical protein
MSAISALSSLFPYICLFYVVDCISYLRKGQAVFSSVIGSSFNVKDSGVRILGLTPLSWSMCVPRLPICFTKTGVALLSYPPQPPNETFISYTDINELECDRHLVKINKQVFIEAPSAAAARHIAACISQLKAERIDCRLDTMQGFLAEATDLHKIKALKTNCEKSVRYVRAFSTMLCFQWLVLLPLAFYTPLGASVDATILFITMMLSLVATIALTHMAHRKLYPDNAEDRMSMLAHTLLWPISCLHVASHLARDVYLRFNYAAVGAALLPAPEAKKLIHKEMTCLEINKARTSEAAIVAYLCMQQQNMEKLCKSIGFSLEDIELLPEKKDELASSYCPVCNAEYRVGFNKCSDCDVDLRSYG